MLRQSSTAIIRVCLALAALLTLVVLIASSSPAFAINSNFKCDYSGCTKKYPHRQSLFRHKQKAHANAQSLKKHAPLQRNYQPHTCEYADCKRSFRTPVGLRRHMRAHIQRKFLTCEVCKQSFTKKNDLVRHFATFRHRDNQRLACLDAETTRQDIPSPTAVIQPTPPPDLPAIDSDDAVTFAPINHDHHPESETDQTETSFSSSSSSPNRLSLNEMAIDSSETAIDSSETAIDSSETATEQPSSPTDLSLNEMASHSNDMNEEQDATDMLLDLQLDEDSAMANFYNDVFNMVESVTALIDAGVVSDP